MVNYECKRCKKIFNHKSDYNKHINRKIKCSQNPLQNKNIPLQQSIVHCIYCEKVFTREDNLQRHIDSRCKVKKQKDAEKKKILDEVFDELKEMKQKIATLEKENAEYKNNKNNQIVKNTTANNNTNSNNTTTNTITNSNNNTQINVKINAFGSEDISFLTDGRVKNILGTGCLSAINLIRIIHFNEKHPDNHNVYISNTCHNIANVFDGKDWIIREKSEVLDDLYNDNVGLLEDKYEELKDDMNERDVKTCDKYLGKKDDEHTKNSTQSIIEKMMYNSRGMVIRTRTRHRAQQKAILLKPKIESLSPTKLKQEDEQINYIDYDDIYEDDTDDIAQESYILDYTFKTYADNICKNLHNVVKV